MHHSTAFITETIDQPVPYMLTQSVFEELAWEPGQTNTPVPYVLAVPLDY